jgi:L-ascorbate metabolism protein UlaG (beta-lactamase superfamily)
MHRLSILLLAVVLLTGCRALKPSADLNNYKPYFVQATGDSTLHQGQVRATFFGTSTLLFDDGETQLFIDGFLSRPGLGKVAFGKVRSDIPALQQVIQQHNINRLKGIFVCHSHYDHAMDAPAVAKLTGAGVYGSSSTINICKGEQLSETQAHTFEPGQTYTFGKFTVTVIASKHTPPFKLLGKTNATDPNHPNIDEPLKQPAKADKYIEGGTYDFYIKHGNKGIMVKASTNYIEGALNSYPADVFFLGAAMLGLQTDTFKNNYYNQTVVATGARTVIPIHWDNFMKPLTKPLQALPNLSDKIDSSFNFLINRTQSQNKQLIILQAHQSIQLF